MIPEHLMHYADPNDYNRIFYHQRNDGMEAGIQTLLTDSDCLLGLCRTDFEGATEYQLFIRCLLDQTVVENEKRRLKCAAGHEPISQRYMQSGESSNLARLRNGVETIPANIRKIIISTNFQEENNVVKLFSEAK